MWEKPPNFEELRKVYLETQGRTHSNIEAIKAMRQISPLSLAQAKNVMCWIEDGCDIIEAQERLVDGLTPLDFDDNDGLKDDLYSERKLIISPQTTSKEKNMATAHEDDVVYAFRQAVEEELRRVQDGGGQEPLLQEGARPEDNLRRLVESHERLQSEVALLRTVILKLVSQPVDFENS